jgi:hypothetical protein
MAQNKLKLNNDKTELLTISSSRQQNKIIPTTLTIGNDIVSPSTTARNLGVILDSNLQLDTHISSICQNSYHHLRNIGKLRKYLTTEATTLVTHAFVSSRLDCNNSLLYGLPKTKLQKLQRIQNSAARIITRTKKNDHITPHLMDLHWLPITKRIEFKILTLVYQCLNNLAPSYLCSLVKVQHPVRTLRSSVAPTLVVPKSKLKSYGDRAFENAAPKLWNSLPPVVRNSETLESFKSALKSHLFRGAYNTNS